MPSTDLHNLSQKKDKLVSTHSHLEQEDLLHAVAGKVYFDKDRPDRYMLLIYSFPESLIENETVAFRNLMLLGFFVLTFLLGIIMYVMLKKIFSPLTQLTNGASAIAEGRHDIEFPKGTSDEVGYLVSAFQYMLKGITSQEQKVATLYEELKRSEVYANHIIESTPQGIIVADTNGQIVRVNKIVLLMFGYDEDEILGQSVELLMPEKFIPDHRINYVNYLNRKDSKPRIMGENHNLTARCKDGSEIAVEIGISPMRLDDKRYVVATIADITERSAIEQELQIAATAFDSHEAMLVTDSQGDILRVNDAFTKVTGYSREEVIGKNPNILQSGRHSADFYHDMWERINQDGCWQGEIWDRRKNGEVYPKWATITSVSDKNGQVSNYVSIFSDISSVKKAQDQILELAYYDPLTGLSNRRRLVEYLERAMVESKRSNMFGALMFIDLDNFKIINDTLGHEQGDVLLKEVANRLTTALREVDIVARLGGDEFVVILHELESDGNRAMQYARHIGENLIRILAKPHILEGRSYVCTGSLGITMYYGNEVSIDEIFRSSDVAMYEAKKRGRNSLRFFDPEMQASLEKRSQMESDLRIALKKKQFVLYFQKQVDNEGRIIGMEALVRWAHPERGMISPSEFIPVCEDSGLIVPVGHWILTESCRTLSQWQQHDSMKHLKLAVNISIKEFMQDDFVSQVNLLVDEYGVHSDRLELEITESMAHDDLDALIEKMHQLKKTGISIAMDDFGTGYSSLSYLKKLPVDIIKIDRSFVDDLGVNANNESIVKTIAKAGESFGMDVLAEGVETEEQFRLLIEYGYKQFQGYYFGKPMTADKFEEEFQSIPRREK
ncbi:EAL domain-containing protein, partial [Solemya velum gill symbiont]|uniref:EAL domain-containing protein n=1 Tax=Solemya velum gill symbiont TaxID=2340 RepID=UPI00117A23D7